MLKVIGSEGLACKSVWACSLFLYKSGLLGTLRFGGRDEAHVVLSAGARPLGLSSGWWGGSGSYWPWTVMKLAESLAVQCQMTLIF